MPRRDEVTLKEGERKDLKPITGMFELLQEDELTTKKERGSASTTHEHIQKASHLIVVTRSRGKLCLSPVLEGTPV